MRLVWTHEALTDREAIHDYIYPLNQTAANALDKRFLALALALISTPKMGRPGKRKGTREFTVNHSYRLIYRIEGDIIYVLNVVHNARNWPRPSRMPS